MSIIKCNASAFIPHVDERDRSAAANQIADHIVPDHRRASGVARSTDLQQDGAVLGQAADAALDVTADVDMLPGPIGMVPLFRGMQSSLSLVFDRALGMLRRLLTAPLPRWFMLLAKRLAAALLSTVQA